jgi:hypothetical protein
MKGRSICIGSADDERAFDRQPVSVEDVVQTDDDGRNLSLSVD